MIESVFSLVGNRHEPCTAFVIRVQIFHVKSVSIRNYIFSEDIPKRTEKNRKHLDDIAITVHEYVYILART